jgi:hypothetical protein
MMMRLWFMYIEGNVIDGNAINDHARSWMSYGSCDILAVACLVIQSSLERIQRVSST